jgi:hypothetical protein
MLWTSLRDMERRLRNMEAAIPGGAASRVVSVASLAGEVPGPVGRMIIAIDTMTLYVSTGTAWKTV